MATRASTVDERPLLEAADLKATMADLDRRIEGVWDGQGREPLDWKLARHLSADSVDVDALVDSWAPKSEKKGKKGDGAATLTKNVSPIRALSAASSTPTRLHDLCEHTYTRASSHSGGGFDSPVGTVVQSKDQGVATEV